jgi:uncharacterized protein YkwD
MPPRAPARRRATPTRHAAPARSHAPSSDPHAPSSGPYAAPGRPEPAASGPWDADFTDSTRSQPPWAGFPDDDQPSGPALLADDHDSVSALLTSDPPAPSSRRIGDPLPPSPQRAGDPPSRSPRRGDDLPPRPPRRTRYLVAILLAVALLGAGGFYLVRGTGTATPTASGTASARPAPASCGPAASAAGSAVSAALAGAIGSDVLTGPAGNAVPCAGRPFGFVTVSPSPLQSAHPRSSPAHRKHPVAGSPSVTPSSSSSPGSAPSSSASASSPSSSAPASPSASASSSSPAGATSGSAAAQVLALINQARSSAGLAPLTISAGLDSSASTHNATMAGGCGLSHQCPGEPDFGARETAAGVHWTAAGENIGEGGPVADTTSAIANMAVALTQGMLNEKPPDDGHRLNILSSSFTHIGIAVTRDSSGTVWLTQDFSN